MTTPPHSYIPHGSIEAAPYEGYCPPKVRQEAFAAVLEGVELGAYDTSSHTSRIDEAAALPSPAVMLSARLKQYYGRLRRPPGTPPTSRFSRL